MRIVLLESGCSGVCFKKGDLLLLTHARPQEYETHRCQTSNNEITHTHALLSYQIWSHAFAGRDHLLPVDLNRLVRELKLANESFRKISETGNAKHSSKSSEKARTIRKRKVFVRFPKLWALHRSSIDSSENTHRVSWKKKQKPGARREFVLLWIRVASLHWTRTHTPAHHPPAAAVHTNTTLITSFTAHSPAVWKVTGQ